MQKYQIANTIIKQLKSLDPFFFANIRMKKQYGILIDTHKVQINCSIISKGKIIIVYNEGKDLYDLEIGKLVKLDYRKLYESNDLYADQLVEIIYYAINEIKGNI